MAKIEIDIKKLEKTAEKLSAIAHPMRIAIISLLEENIELNVTDICLMMRIAQPTVSHHLSVLKNKDLLIARKEGKQIFYSLNNAIILKTLSCIDK
jgi:DNA-binding transcriptional ArsR family regulator